jgi:hypothetical protein
VLFYNVEVVNVIPRVKGTMRGKEKKNNRNCPKKEGEKKRNEASF